MKDKILKVAVAKFKKIPSNNVLVMPGVHYKTGKPKGYLYKNPTIQKYQDSLKRQLKVQLESYELPNKYYSVSLIFFLYKGFDKRDVSNMFKIAEDAVKDVIHKDDSKYINIHGYKRLSIDKNEYVVLLISDAVLVDMSNIEEMINFRG